MNLQNLCHFRSLCVLPLALGFTAMAAADDAGPTAVPAHDYPTVARVEFVNECVAKSGGKLAAVYQCSCAIDRIADALAYDDFVEASTYAKYASLPGQGGSIFRDSDHARSLAKSYRDLESKSLRGCGMSP
jgi:hypothetical protein